jgi:hypothetical protein
MLLVNGYVCRNCTDEALAKRGIDPAHPDKSASTNGGIDPAHPERTKKGDATGALDKTKSKDGVHGAIGPSSKDDPANIALGKNEPDHGATVGGSLNLYA